MTTGADAPARKIRHPRNVRILPRSRCRGLIAVVLMLLIRIKGFVKLVAPAACAPPHMNRS